MQKISKIIFIKYKAFEKYAVSLRNINILVGPNNCGKSTIIGALRLLEVGIKRAQVKSPTIIDRHEGRAGWGYKLNEETSPISIENVHFNYADEPALVEFQLSDGAKLFLYFPVDGGAYFYGESLGSRVTSPTSFRKSFPLSIVSIPILGPVEHNEDLVSLETVRTNISSHRASRNFRSYWHYNKVDFSEFRELIRSTWKGMDVLPPSYSGGNVIMMCKDGRIERELYWSGYGFQIWCQMMSHLARANNASHIIIDEPEVYLHPDVQRKLFALLNKYESHVVIATHSTELLSEADIEDIVLIDKLKPRGTRLKDEDGVQLAMETLGSTHCISLMRMAKSRKILFVEAIEDFKILCKFGKKMQLDLANSQDQFVVRESDGFGNWTNIKAFSWGFNKITSNSVKIFAVFDRDYYTEEKIQDVKKELGEVISGVHVWGRKEIENYLIVPAAIHRYVNKKLENSDSVKFDDIERIVTSVVDSLRNETETSLISEAVKMKGRAGVDVSQAISKIVREFTSSWDEKNKKHHLVCGKDVLSRVNAELKTKYNVSFTKIQLVDSMLADELPADLREAIVDIDNFIRS